MLLGGADGGSLHRVRCRKPSVKRKRVPRRGKDRTTIDERYGRIEAQAHPFDQGGEVPGVDRLAVDRGLAAHRVEPRAVGPGRDERMRGQGRIEAGEGRGGAFEIDGEGDRQRRGTAWRMIVIQRHRCQCPNIRSYIDLSECGIVNSDPDPANAAANPATL